MGKELASISDLVSLVNQRKFYVPGEPEILLPFFSKLN